jgi:hypothetical protein
MQGPSALPRKGRIMDQGKITKSELTMLKACTSEKEWNTTCDSIKQNHNGMYPTDWRKKVIASGLASEIASSW